MGRPPSHGYLCWRHWGETHTSSFPQGPRRLRSHAPVHLVLRKLAAKAGLISSAQTSTGGHKRTDHFNYCIKVRHDILPMKLCNDIDSCVVCNRSRPCWACCATWRHMPGPARQILCMTHSFQIRCTWYGQLAPELSWHFWTESLLTLPGVHIGTPPPLSPTPSFPAS